MPELTREEKIKIFEKLPKELQNLMQSEDTGAFLLYLGKKYNLTNEKVRLLSKLVGDVILGIIQITSLAQEISAKITADPQIAMNLAQELYTDLLAPAMKSLSTPIPTHQEMAVGTPTPAQRGVGATPIPSTDRYREPTSGPEVVDLRKAPIMSPPPIQVPPPLPVKPAPPLTFTKPVEPLKLIPKPAPPLIEAEPHLPAYTPKGFSTGEHVKVSPPPTVVSQVKPPVAGGFEPQYIIRPPGVAPTDMPRNILDLKKDKGEF